MLAQEEQQIGQVTDDGQIDSPLRVTRFVGAVATAPFLFETLCCRLRILWHVFESREPVADIEGIITRKETPLLDPIDDFKPDIVPVPSVISP